MAYMIEITQEAKGEIMDHAEVAYEHLGKMLECLDEACESGKMGNRGGHMGMREDDEWYIRRMNGDRMNRKMGRRMGSRGSYGRRNNVYSTGGGYGYRHGGVDEEDVDPMYED